ncbi:hypothetical protein AVEN_89633-1 [Araneus ventricosus]|uniref:Uncharacterized protein n=1 Tax=Araneus ventricosus TaxID=182803 RepID=A0A4Y2NV34_ARAVE|nr:hypothetical protein AVEN_89633-1 [Araneus ventricosus]
MPIPSSSSGIQWGNHDLDVIHRSSKMEFLEHGKRKLIVKIENLSNLEKMIRNGGIQKELKNRKLHPPIPLSDLDARLSAKQRICLHWHLTTRVEMKLEFPRVGGERSLCG